MSVNIFILFVFVIILYIIIYTINYNQLIVVASIMLAKLLNSNNIKYCTINLKHTQDASFFSIFLI